MHKDPTPIVEIDGQRSNACALIAAAALDILLNSNNQEEIVKRFKNHQNSNKTIIQHWQTIYEKQYQNQYGSGFNAAEAVEKTNAILTIQGTRSAKKTNVTSSPKTNNDNSAWQNIEHAVKGAVALRKDIQDNLDGWQALGWGTVLDALENNNYELVFPDDGSLDVTTASADEILEHIKKVNNPTATAVQHTPLEEILQRDLFTPLEKAPQATGFLINNEGHTVALAKGRDNAYYYFNSYDGKLFRFVNIHDLQNYLNIHLFNGQVDATFTQVLSKAPAPQLTPTSAAAPTASKPMVFNPNLYVRNPNAAKFSDRITSYDDLPTALKTWLNKHFPHLKSHEWENLTEESKFIYWTQWVIKAGRDTEGALTFTLDRLMQELMLVKNKYEQENNRQFATLALDLAKKVAEVLNPPKPIAATVSTSAATSPTINSEERSTTSSPTNPSNAEHKKEKEKINEEIKFASLDEVINASYEKLPTPFKNWLTQRQDPILAEAWNNYSKDDKVLKIGQWSLNKEHTSWNHVQENLGFALTLSQLLEELDKTNKNYQSQGEDKKTDYLATGVVIARLPQTFSDQVKKQVFTSTPVDVANTSMSTITTANADSEVKISPKLQSNTTGSDANTGSISQPAPPSGKISQLRPTTTQDSSVMTSDINTAFKKDFENIHTNQKTQLIYNQYFSEKPTDEEKQNYYSRFDLKYGIQALYIKEGNQINITFKDEQAKNTFIKNKDLFTKCKNVFSIENTIQINSNTYNELMNNNSAYQKLLDLQPTYKLINTLSKEIDKNKNLAVKIAKREALKDIYYKAIEGKADLTATINAKKNKHTVIQGRFLFWSTSRTKKELKRLKTVLNLKPHQKK